MTDPPIEPTQGGYQPAPNCGRCGRPFAEHHEGQCPGPHASDLMRGVANGFAIIALLGAIVLGAAWLGTIGSARSCTFTGKLEGGTCYPFLNTVHTASGPLALAPLIVVALLFIVPTGR